MKDGSLGLLGLLAAAIAAVPMALSSRLISEGAFIAVAHAADATAAQKTASDSYSGPKTPWGHPDLQGVWNNSTDRKSVV